MHVVLEGVKKYLTRDKCFQHFRNYLESGFFGVIFQRTARYRSNNTYKRSFCPVFLANICYFQRPIIVVHSTFAPYGPVSIGFSCESYNNLRKSLSERVFLVHFWTNFLILYFEPLLAWSLSQKINKHIRHHSAAFFLTKWTIFTLYRNLMHR